MSKDSNPSIFRLTCEEILNYLSVHIPMPLWMVTRVNGDEWIAIDAIDSFERVKPFTTANWSESLSYRMVMGFGPKIAPRCHEVPSYVNAPCYRRDQVAAYVGIPLELPNGRLFGVLSGVDFKVNSDDLHQALPTLELIGATLMQVYTAEMQSVKLESRLEHAESPHWRDENSGSLNFGAWLNDCVSAEWTRINHMEPGGIVAVHTPTDDARDKVHDILIEACPSEHEVYFEDDHTSMVMLRGLCKQDQQAVFKDVKKALEGLACSAQAVHVYRGPTRSMCQAFQEVKQNLAESAKRCAA